MATFTAINFNFQTNHNRKWMKSRSFSGSAIDDFRNELNTINWESVFDTNLNADPQITYDNSFSVKLDDLIDKHFPLKYVKYNKYKHKKSKWIKKSFII